MMSSANGGGSELEERSVHGGENEVEGGSARGERSDTLSLSSLMDTLCKEKPKTDMGGYESVIDELCTKIDSENKPGFKGQDQRNYLNVGAGNISIGSPSSDAAPTDAGGYEILPDLCANVPPLQAAKTNESQAKKESSVATTPSGTIEIANHTYATVKRKVAKSYSQPAAAKSVDEKLQQENSTASPPEDGNIELLSYHRLNNDLDLPSIGDSVNGPGVKENIGNADKTLRLTVNPNPPSNYKHNLHHRQTSNPETTVVKLNGNKSSPEVRPFASPEPSVSTFLIRQRSAAISAPSIQQYNPKISEAVKARRSTGRRTPPLPPRNYGPIPPELPPPRSTSSPNPIPPELPAKRRNASNTRPVSAHFLSPINGQTSAGGPAIFGSTPHLGIEPMPVLPPALRVASPDMGPMPVSIEPQFKRAESSSEATALFEPLSSHSNGSPTMSEDIMKKFPKPEATGFNSEFSTVQDQQANPLHQSSWHSTLVGAIRNSYRTLHRSLQSGSAYSLPAQEAKDLKDELKVVLTKRSSVLID